MSTEVDLTGPATTPVSKFDVRRSAGVGASVGWLGLWQALRRMRDPVLFGVLPLAWALYVLGTQHFAFGPLGFDFQGTVWEPARALIDGRSPYPPPTREAIEVGNPAVYPPFVPLLAIPLGFLSLTVAKLVWSLLLVAAVITALWTLRVRDWRCYTVTLTALPVLEGLFWGNTALLLLVPVAVAWRYRDAARPAGIAVGVAIAAKLFAWPLIVWLVLTRRYRAAIWAASCATMLILGPWAIIGFDGFLEYPALLHVLQDVYAVRSFSLATIAAGFGASADVGVAIATVAGLALLAFAGWLAHRPHGDVRSFAVVIAACVMASPVVWPYYFSMLFIPIAIAWRRLAPAWFFGYAIVTVVVVPAYSVPDPEPCCRPDDVPRLVWAVSHTMPAPWEAIGIAMFVGVVIAGVMRKASRTRRATPRPAQ